MATITYEAVAAACEKIEAAGKKPTQASVRKALGGGSFTTIGPFLTQWKEAKAESEELSMVEVPDDLEVAGSEMVAKLWTAAMREASTGHAELQRSLLAAQEEIKAAEAETQEIATSLEADIEGLRDQLGALEAKHGEIDAQFRAEHEARTVAERDLAVTRERAEAEGKRAAKAEQRADQLQETVTASERASADLRKRYDDVTSQLSETRAELSAATTAKDSLAAELSKAEDRATKAEARTAKAEERSDKLEAAQEKLREKLDTVQADHASLRADLANARAERTQAHERLKEAQEHIKELEGGGATAGSAKKSGG